MKMFEMIVAVIWCLFINQASASPYFPDLNHVCHAIQRDLNLVYQGILSTPVIDDNGFKQCSKQIYLSTSVAHPQAFIWAINEVNRRTDLLPNISLGFINLDSCRHDLTGLATSMYLAPDQNDTDYFPDNELILCQPRYKRFRNVVGVVGPGYSRQAVMSVPVLGLHQIPMVLTYATSDDLSDKARFPYSLRLVPPDRFQADAMTDILVHFNWTYASLLYIEGSYGENGAKEIRKNAKKKGICIAFEYMVPSIYVKKDILTTVDKLIKNKKARTILAFINMGVSNDLGPEIIRRGYGRYFTWVGADSFRWQKESDGLAFDGAFFVGFYSTKSPVFRNYYQSLTPERIDNPWLIRTWEMFRNCNWGEATAGKESCSGNKAFPEEIKLDNYAEVVIDGVNVFAKALHHLILNSCPDAFFDKSLLKDCVKGPVLLQYVRNTSMIGYSGILKFDDNGDIYGSYRLNQYHHDTGEKVVAAVWNALTKTLEVNDNNLRWYNEETGIIDAPESVCSKSCVEKQYFIQKELPCCWECRECRENEILVQNQTGCEECQRLTWPDEETATVCEVIAPAIVQWSDPISIGLVILTSFGGALCLITGIILIKNREVKIIKASSHQLMSIILFGIMVAFTTGVVFLVKPSIPTCFVTRFGFNIAVSLIYGPLVVKTSRVYRIFSAGKKGTKKPSFVGNRAQLIMVIALLLIQLCLCIVSVLIGYPEPVYRMPVATEKYVEVSCNLPLSALLPPLSFNILLSLTCAAFGFITRKLPANFNESWFIFVSVATTSFLWVVFLPAYFTAFYAIHQIVLLASCLFINGLVTLVCLYVPKVYCIYFVDESSLQIQTAGKIGTVGTADETESTQATDADK